MPRPRKVKLPDTHFAFTDISKQDDSKNIQRQNYWVSQGHWVPVQFMTEKECQWYELKNRGMPLGVITYLLGKEDKQVYTSIFILPEHRNKGYAKELYDLTLPKYKKSGVFAYIGVDNKYSVKLHESVGFKLIDKNASANKFVYKWG